MGYPSDNQKAGLQFLVDSVESGERVVVLSGQGGSGKTTVAKDLSEVINAEIHFCASTNKAASRLHESINKESDKGIEVKTLHSRICIPVFTRLYHELETFYGTKDDKGKLSIDDFEKTYPKAMELLERKHVKLKDMPNFDSVHDFINHVELDPFGRELFVKYDLIQDEKRELEGVVLLVDESGMVPKESVKAEDLIKVIGLDSALEVYSRIILLGDIEQLPPIVGESSFDELPTFVLTENFRCNDHLKGIIQWVLDGKDPTLYKPTPDELPYVRIQGTLSQDWYDKANKRSDVVNICYTNKTRKSITKRIRGKNPDPVEGDVIFYNGFTNSNNIKGDMGVVNSNLLFEYYKDDENGEREELPYYVTTNTAKIFDEYVKGKGWSFMRYGYAMTAHMAQGSEFDHVIVHVNDIPHFIDAKAKRQWIYTAISRAKKTITIVGY